MCSKEEPTSLDKARLSGPQQGHSLADGVLPTRCVCMCVCCVCVCVVCVSKHEAGGQGREQEGVKAKSTQELSRQNCLQANGFSK